MPLYRVVQRTIDERIWFVEADSEELAVELMETVDEGDFEDLYERHVLGTPDDGGFEAVEWPGVDFGLRPLTWEEVFEVTDSRGSVDARPTDVV